jgi:hypothetical protein
VGEWFLDPAHAAAVLHLQDLPERVDPGFYAYVDNRFLQGDVVLAVDTPAAGATWTVGTSELIEWTHDDAGQGPAFAGTVDIDLSRGGDSWEPIAAGVPIAGGGFSWPVTGPPTGVARIRVRAGTDCILTLSAVSDDISIVSDVTGVAGLEGSGVLLHPARPNPFVQKATLAFELNEALPVRLRVFDVVGRPVRTLVDGAPLPAGPHAFSWDGRDDRGRRVVPGLYSYRLDAGNRALTRKLVLAR